MEDLDAKPVSNSHLLLQRIRVSTKIKTRWSVLVPRFTSSAFHQRTPQTPEVRSISFGPPDATFVRYGICPTLWLPSSLGLYQPATPCFLVPCLSPGSRMTKYNTVNENFFSFSAFFLYPTQSRTPTVKLIARSICRHCFGPPVSPSKCRRRPPLLACTSVSFPSPPGPPP